MTSAAILRDWDGLGIGTHAGRVENALQVVNFMGYESGDCILEDRDAAIPVAVLVLHTDAERSGHHASYVEEAPAPLVLLVGLAGLLDDPGV